MKRLILAFAFLTIILPPLVALARAGSYRSAIDRKWNEVQAWQKMQDALFKAIEREAAKGGATLRPMSRMQYLLMWPVPPVFTTAPHLDEVNRGRQLPNEGPCEG